MSHRTKMLRVRLNDDEWDALNHRAERADLSMSELVRTSLGKIRVVNRKDARAKIAMLNRINANLNMIAKWVNIHQDTADVIEVIATLMAIDREVKRLAE